MEIEDSLDNWLEKIEQPVLNIAGYIPVISQVSGPLRMALGQCEIIAGLAAAAFMAIAALFNPNAQERQHQLNKALEIAVKYTLHGGANLFRGSIELVPFFSLVTCLPYDLFGNRFSYIRGQGSNPGHYVVEQYGR
jgi:hypothetical protein